MLPDRLPQVLGAEVRSAEPVRGGDNSRAHRVELADGRVVFVKTHPAPPPGFYSTEARSLDWLWQANTVAVPRPLAHSDDEPAFLALQWIEPGPMFPETDADLGRALARLHQSGASTFGRSDRRPTGSQGLPNEPCDTWTEFFVTQRLEPLLRIATDRAALPPHLLAALRGVADRIETLAGPTEPAARLHGDLWAGNRVVDNEGRSWLVDPAARGGHREADLAMMRLFGGFGPDCFDAYDEVFPLLDGWTRRIPLHQLPPLVVHAVRFGGHYVGRVEQALLQLR